MTAPDSELRAPAPGWGAAAWTADRTAEEATVARRVTAADARITLTRLDPAVHA